MLVYGDRHRTIDPREVLDGLAADMAALRHAAAGLPRHARIAQALIAAGELAQGLADVAFAERGGVDARSPAADLAQAVTDGLGADLAASWRTGFAAGAPSTTALAQLRAVLPIDPVVVSTCEGYAYYAVYPELYAEAAATMHPAPRIVGLRSIGTSLAAAAAAGCGSAKPLTLRPFGDPFAREVRLAPALAAELTGPSPGGWAVVDEGPGLSGSSFAAVGAFLEAQGVPAAAVAYLPGHGGDPGPEAPAERRARWTRTRKPRVDFDDAIKPRLAAWAEPLVGPALAPLEDLSGGLWRAHGVPDAPSWPEQERRKFLLRTDAGVFMLKFAGLGPEGAAKLAGAQKLHRAGFTAEPLGLVHGFLVERWIHDAHSLPLEDHRLALLDHLTRYLALRTRLAPPERGASADQLRVMMVRNLGLAGLHAAADMAANLASPTPGRPAAIDGRLHAWEWRVGAQGQLLKTDALDHAQAHDLIAAQDLAWDVAGASVEFALSRDEGESLRASLAREAALPLDPRRVAFATLAYLAFQIGWWRMAANGSEGARAAAQCARYEELAREWMPDA